MFFKVPSSPNRDESMIDFASLKTDEICTLENFSKVLNTELAQLPLLLRALFHSFEAVLSQ